MTPDLLPESLAKRIDVDDNGCWIPRKKPKRNGYVWIGYGGRKQYFGAHRLTWTLLVGDIAPGLVIDHLCRVRSCCNPAHLEVVTPRENTLRGNTLTAVNAAKTHCKRGHEFTASNTYMHPRGERICRECRRQRRKALKATA